MLLDPSADVFSFVCLLFSFLLFRCPPPQRRSEVRDSSGAAAAGQRSGVLLKYFLCVQRMFWQPSWLQPPQESREEDFFCFSCRETFFFFSCCCFCFSSTTDWHDRKSDGNKKRNSACHGPAATDTIYFHDLWFVTAICLFFYPPFIAPHSAVPLVSLLNFAQQSWIKKRETDIWVYIYILKNI